MNSDNNFEIMTVNYIYNDFELIYSPSWPCLVYNQSA